MLTRVLRRFADSQLVEGAGMAPNCSDGIISDTEELFNALPPGAPVFVNNANLTPGNEYYNIFSVDLCPGGPASKF